MPLWPDKAKRRIRRRRAEYELMCRKTGGSHPDTGSQPGVPVATTPAPPTSCCRYLPIDAITAIECNRDPCKEVSVL